MAKTLQISPLPMTEISRATLEQLFRRPKLAVFNFGGGQCNPCDIAFIFRLFPFASFSVSGHFGAEASRFRGLPLLHFLYDS